MFDKKNRKRIFFVIILILVIIVGFETLISYRWLKVDEYSLSAEQIQTPVRMVVVSDLHDHKFGKDNASLVDKVKAQEPDLILMCGDFLNEDSKDHVAVVELVKDFRKIAPVYYALGNHELAYLNTNQSKSSAQTTRQDTNNPSATQDANNPSATQDANNSSVIQDDTLHAAFLQDLASAGAVVVDQAYEDVTVGDTKLRIGGLYDYAFALDGNDTAENTPEPTKSFLEDFQDTDNYKIMLSHRPDSFIFGNASQYWDVDLVVSGHNHGGQVVVPFLGGLFGGDQGWFPEYIHGMYDVGNLKLFATSGLGSEKQLLPRWNNRPEIAVIQLGAAL